MDLVRRVPVLPVRPFEGHKGVFGRVLVAGGSEGMIGAPVLAGTAALRTGAGLVQLAVPRAILPFALSITPELIGVGLGGSDGPFLKAVELANVVVVGPGMGQSGEAKRRVRKLLALDKRLVVDADALNCLAAGARWPGGVKARAILTPHPGEMARLSRILGTPRDIPEDTNGRIAVAVAAAKASGQVVVLKGHRTVVTDGKRVYVNNTGDSTLSKAGSGDVLCGILAALLSQMGDLIEAAIVAVRLHGLAGELAGRRLGRRCALARDVIDAIPAVIRAWS